LETPKRGSKILAVAGVTSGAKQVQNDENTHLQRKITNNKQPDMRFIGDMVVLPVG
jgi:hypothetical protein